MTKMKEEFIELLNLKTKAINDICKEIDKLITRVRKLEERESKIQKPTKEETR